MKLFSMPSDFKKSTIDEYQKINNTYPNSKIFETYGNITKGNIIESGRALNQLPQIDLTDLSEYIKYCNDRNIKFNYTINAPHILNKEFTKSGLKSILAFLDDLFKAGVRSLTVALPSLADIVMMSKNEFEIKASTLCQINNANKALNYKNRGFKRIVPDESINKNFKKLRQISQSFGNGVELIINPVCYKDCIYRMFHYNQLANDSLQGATDTSINYYEHRCVLQRHTKISNMLKISWIRPEDLKYYESIGIHYFKLQGRQLIWQKKADPMRTIKAYFDEKFDGDLMDLNSMFITITKFKIPLPNNKLDGYIKPFYDEKIICENDCDSCKYCDKYSKKCIDIDKANEIIALAKDFYSEYDQFNELIKEVKNELNYTLNELNDKEVFSTNEFNFE